MNGIHDMGGMHGMGPVEPEPNEPVFHAPWEGRVYALFARGVYPWSRGRNWPHFRFALESIPAADYLRMSYYERWFTVLVDNLLGSDLITEEELETGRADPNRPKPELLEGEPRPFGRMDVAVPPGFQPDQQVRARNIHPRGHTRLPRYTRGKQGTIVFDHGVFALQDTDENGQFLDVRPQHVYTVAFSARELWGEQASIRDVVNVDLWEDYLEPA